MSMPQPEVEMEDYLRECVKIEPLAIQEEFVRIPMDLAYWNARYARALKNYLMSKIEVDVMYARLEPEIRQALINAGAKVTEAQVKSAIESNEDYIAVRRDQVNAEVEKNELFGCLDAIRSKKEMLISLGAHLRAEMEGDPTIREHNRGAKLMTRSRGEMGG